MSSSHAPGAPGKAAVTDHGPPELKRVMGAKLLLLFIMGDILGTGVYALTGQVASQIGGAAWAPIIVAFAVATVTAFSYLELVTKYPGASGAALYTHKAFGVGFLTFMVTFAVLASGLTSAATAAITVASNFNVGFGLDMPPVGVVSVAVVFMLILAAINIRGVSESVKLNVVLTLIELTGLLLVIFVGFWAMSQGTADFSQVTVFHTPEDKSVFLVLTAVTSLAFFSFVGFEDSVNMVEETKDPRNTFPKVMLGGLGICLVVYVLVSIFTVALVPIGVLGESTTPLVEVVHRGAPGVPIDSIYPFLTIFAVANTALINMLMASRLLYGMARQGVLPGFLGKVHPTRRTPWTSILFTTALAIALLTLVGLGMGKATATALGGTTALLLLGVFAIVNIALLVLRRDTSGAEDHFRAPTPMPYIGAFTTAFLIGPWAQDPIEYQIAAILLAIGVALSVANWTYKRFAKHERMNFENPDELGNLGDVD